MSPFEPKFREPADLIAPTPEWIQGHATTLSRADLRSEIQGTLAQSLAPSDIAAMVAIGMVGALPTGPVTNAPPWLADLIGRGPVVREIVVQHITDGSITGFGLRSAIDAASAGDPRIAWFAPMLSQGIDRGIIPDLEDGFETLATAALTDRWCKHRGWFEGQQIYHHAKALAYAINAGVGAYFNPDPLAFGLAIWHLYKAIQASRGLTEKLRMLVDRAIDDGEQAIRVIEGEITITDGQIQAPASRRFGSRDDLDSFFPAETRRSR
jgi:hypothetical protein